jgi:hypothetical protein
VKKIALAFGRRDEVAVAVFDPQAGHADSTLLKGKDNFREHLTGFVERCVGGKNSSDLTLVLELLNTDLPITFDSENAQQELMQFLQALGPYGAVNMSINTENHHVFISEIPEMMRAVVTGEKCAQLIPPGLASEVCRISGNPVRTLEDTAIMIAKIGANDNLYRFLRSDGDIPIGFDVIRFLTNPQNNYYIIGDGIWYCLVKDASTMTETTSEEIQSFFLKERELIANDAIPESQAKRLVLLSASIRYSFGLYCGEADNKRDSPIFRPSPLGAAPARTYSVF